MLELTLNATKSTLIVDAKHITDEVKQIRYIDSFGADVWELNENSEWINVEEYDESLTYLDLRDMQVYGSD